MHKTEGANNDSGRFTDGPPATTLESDLMNALCDEVIYVIESAGITLKTAGTETGIQLREALLKTVPMPRGYIDGLIMSNTVGDTEHDISISVGKCRDSGDANSILFNAAMVKQIDVNWAEGTNEGGFPAGLGLAIDTWYHFYIIMSADGTKIDAGFDTSLTAVNLLGDATDYFLYRRIGSVLTDGSSNIIAFHQDGDYFEWDVRVTDVNQANPGVAAVLATISVPTGMKIRAHLSVGVLDATVGAVWGLILTDPDANATAPSSSTMADLLIPACGGGVSSVAVVMYVVTNTSSQIRYELSYTAADVDLYITTKGWLDQRGKDI